MKNFIKKGLTLFGLGGVSTLASAQATLPTAATDAITEIGDLADLLITAFWPVVGAVTVGFVLFKLFKRGSNKV